VLVLPSMHEQLRARGGESRCGKKLQSTKINAKELMNNH